MMLQTLVENAVKHGMRTSSLPLSIRVSIRREDAAIVCEVENDGTLTERDTEALDGTGLGIRNVKERLKALLPGQHHFELTQDSAGVRARVSYQAIRRAGEVDSWNVH